VQIERLSIELSERCSKGCGFCYNGSNREGASAWDLDDLRTFVVECAAHGTKAFSFGGGEPLEAPELLWPVLAALRGLAFRSMTTNGLLLDDEVVARLAAAAVDKVHVSIHTPQDRDEVTRVIANVGALAAAGVRSGVNLLVRKSRLDAARDAARALHDAGIANERIVYLPMRGTDVPSPNDVALVAAGLGREVDQLLSCRAAAGAGERLEDLRAKVLVLLLREQPRQCRGSGVAHRRLPRGQRRLRVRVRQRPPLACAGLGLRVDHQEIRCVLGRARDQLAVGIEDQDHLRRIIENAGKGYLC